MTPPLDQKTVHLWVPGCRPSTGGLQAFSYYLARALAQEFPQINLRIFSKHDENVPPEFPITGQVRFLGTGKYPGVLRSSAFASHLTVAALRDKPVLILSTHVNFTPLARCLKRIWGIPYATVAHGIDVWNLKNRSVVAGLKDADAVLSVSRFTRDILQLQQGITRRQLRMLPNTIDGTAYLPGPKPDSLLQRYGLKPGQPVILTVSRLGAGERYKGYDRILGILPLLRQRLPDVHYLLAGRGPDSHRIEAMIRALGLEDCVTLTGFVPDYELPDLYRLCDVFAMPSRKEGFGIVFLEALATGKPVIAGNQDGSVDPLADGALGVLVDPVDSEQLLVALHQVLTGAHPLAILKDPAGLRQGALERFGFPAFAARVKAEVERLLVEC